MNEAASVTVLKVENLAKSVITADHPAADPLVLLHPMEFTIAAGETVAIVGPSGSGKSTLLGLLAGLDVPSSGRIYLNGSDLTTLDEDGRACLRGQNIGFVFQSFQLLNNLTALENVMLPLELAGDAEATPRATAELQRVGLGARLQHFPRQLSGGEQQRVAIARAFVTRPGLLLADEPTGNLDAHTGHVIIDLLFELNALHHTTLVLVTHDPELAQRCRRQLVLDAGRLQPVGKG
jgi:putative ABC transport system ATP-binding protein